MSESAVRAPLSLAHVLDRFNDDYCRCIFLRTRLSVKYERGNNIPGVFSRFTPKLIKLKIKLKIKNKIKIKLKIKLDLYRLKIHLEKNILSKYPNLRATMQQESLLQKRSEGITAPRSIK